MVDRISQLPESVVHHILCFLNSPIDLVRISVLSKEWFAIMASISIPNLELNIHHFYRYENNVFFKYIADTISKFRNKNICLHTFKITTDLFRSKQVDTINECLGLILKTRLQVLVINVGRMRHVPYENSRYRLPDILLSISSLTSLKIMKCDLPSSLMINGVKFTSLKILKLVDVCINDEMIKYLTNCCPLLEKLYVVQCDGYSKFCLYGHQNLRKIRIEYSKEIERIDIEAPNLSVIFLVKWCDRDPCISLSKCKKLTTLACTYLNTKELTEFSTKFPFIENLILYYPIGRNNLTFSSDTLKTLALYSPFNFESIMIDAPNLLFFKYSHNQLFSQLLKRNSYGSKTQKVMECYPGDNVGSLWYLQLKGFLDKHNIFKVLKLHISTNFINVVELKRIQSPPYELEHIVLELDTIRNLSVYEAVVDVVLWCFRPRSLTLTLKFSFITSEERDHVVKLAYDKLLQQEDEGQTNIQMVMSSTSKAEKHFSSLTSLLTTLPLPSDQITQTITFVKKKIRRKAKVMNQSKVCQCDRGLNLLIARKRRNYEL